MSLSPLKRVKDLTATTVELIQSVYLKDQRPWVVGYSGGKDSTGVVQLIFAALSQLPPAKRQKKSLYFVFRHIGRDSCHCGLSR